MRKKELTEEEQARVNYDLAMWEAEAANKHHLLASVGPTTSMTLGGIDDVQRAVTAILWYTTAVEPIEHADVFIAYLVRAIPRDGAYQVDAPAGLAEAISRAKGWWMDHQADLLVNEAVRRARLQELAKGAE